MAAVEAESRDRGARVLREIHVNALSTAGEPTHRSRTPANSSTPKALLALAGKYGRLLDIHAPWDHRFAVGVDLAAGDKQHAHSVRAIGFGLLAHLPPATAEKAASWNAGLGFELR